MYTYCSRWSGAAVSRAAPRRRSNPVHPHLCYCEEVPTIYLLEQRSVNKTPFKVFFFFSPLCHTRQVFIVWKVSSACHYRSICRLSKMSEDDCWCDSLHAKMSSHCNIFPFFIRYFKDVIISVCCRCKKKKKKKRRRRRKKGEKWMDHEPSFPVTLLFLFELLQSHVIKNRCYDCVCVCVCV